MKINAQRPHSPTVKVEWKEKELERVFDLFDQNGKGHIEEEDLKCLLGNFGMHITSKELADLTNSCRCVEESSYHTGIDNDKFSIFVEQIFAGELSDDDIKSAYKLFDRNECGYVTREDLRDVMCKWSREPSEEELDEMMEEVDLNGDGVIDFYEFLTAIIAT